MVKINENELSAMLLENFTLRAIEPNVYSVLPDNKAGNEYDSQFGFIYDFVACNPIYNRLIWGYSVKIFPQIASEALHSSYEGHVLDIGCGSLAFIAKVYSQYSERSVVLVDQSLKILRMAKSRLVKKTARFQTIWFSFTLTLFNFHFKKTFSQQSFLRTYFTVFTTQVSRSSN
jgi:SAM-dependent methyltransferase